MNILAILPPAATMLAAFLVPLALPSDPVGVYGILDQVVLKPDAEQPTEVELHGAFAVAEGRHGNYYQAPRIGVLRFAAGKEPAEAVQQWRELQRLAGSGQVVGFSSRYEQSEGGAPLAVADPQGKASALPPFGAGFGLHKLAGVDYGPARELSLLPRCQPAAAGEMAGRNWPARQVTFTCTNCTATDQDLGYVFEVRTSDGDRFASGVVAAGKGTTSWTAELALQEGETIEWSVHAVGSKVGRAPCATARFALAAKTGKGER